MRLCKNQKKLASPFFTLSYDFCDKNLTIFLTELLPRPFPVRNGRGQNAVIKLRVSGGMMVNGPIRAKHVNRSSTVIG